MVSRTEAADVSAQGRIDEVASILARGILRLRGRLRRDVTDSEEYAENSLDLSSPPRPDRVNGLAPRGPERGGEPWG